MRTLVRVALCALLTFVLCSCLAYNKEGPVDVRCPSCNYQIEHR